jgi:hypothetical protein
MPDIYRPDNTGLYWEGANHALRVGRGARVTVTATPSQVTEDVTFGVQHTYDDLFRHNTFLHLALTFPDGKPTRWFRPRPPCVRTTRRPTS